MKIINKILNIDLKDNIKFNIIGLEKIRDEDEYGGYRFNIETMYERIVVYLTIDITTGDKITPREIKYTYKSMFSNETYIIMSYPNETSIAEKFESVIVKGENNTRGRDFYDLYMLMNLDGINIDDELLVKAIMNTFTKRGSSNHLKSLVEIIKTIETSDRLKAVWSNYQEQYYYAQNITYTQIIDSLKIIVNLVIKINEQ